MYYNFSRMFVKALLFGTAVINVCNGAAIFPSAIQTQKGSSSVDDQTVSALSKKDQSGSQDSWGKYVEFYGNSPAYQGVFTFDASDVDASSVGTYSLDVNFKGPRSNAQKWQFEFYEPASNSWVFAGDNSDAQNWKWTSLSFCGTTDFASLVANGNIQVRLSSTEGDACDLDYLAITTTAGTPSSSSSSSGGGGVAHPTQAATDAPTKAPTDAPTEKPTKAPTNAPTDKPTKAPTQAPTDKPTKAPTVAPTDKPTKAPTARPTSAPTSAPTSKPSTTGSSSTTGTVPGGRMCPTGQIWAPAPGTTWQWQLTGTIDQSIDVQMYDIDLFDNDASTIASLHAKGRAVICYFSTQYENWRPDAAAWPASILGSNLDDWPGEKYADIRSTQLRTIMQARLDLAVSKGCDGVEPDNVDEYTNSNGLGITAADQINFNTWMANEAHKRGLSVGLKNDLDQVKSLQPVYDWALNEQCNQYGECGDLSAFVSAGKAVFGTEYSGSASKFCPSMVTSKFSWLLKDLDLSAKLTQCCTYASGGCATKPAFKCLSNNAKRSEFEVDEAVIAEEVAIAASPAEPASPSEFASSATTAAVPVVAAAVVAIAALVL